jgi:transposase-like protein
VWCGRGRDSCSEGGRRPTGEQESGLDLRAANVYLMRTNRKEKLMSKHMLTDEQKYQAVLDLLQGKESTSAICTRYQISQTYLYKLRDRALEAMAESVKNRQERPFTREDRLENDLSRAKLLIADQAIVIQAFKKKLGLINT